MNDVHSKTATPERKIDGLGVADLLIIGAELLHELVDAGNEAEVSAVTTLKSTGLKYKAKMIVTQVNDDENEQE